MIDARDSKVNVLTSKGPRPPRGPRGDGKALALLEAAFGSPLPRAEGAMWAAMSADQRSTALQRLKVLLRFDQPNNAPTVERAAADAGLSLNRWYEMHRQWREMRSLSSIGTSAAKPRTRTLSHHNILQRLVTRVVDANPEGSVRQLALALGEALDKELEVAAEDRPSYNTLRKFAENEKRRRAREVSPGNELMLDCCACTLPHAEGIFVAFLALDRGTRAILGAALGDARNSRAGYALAAQDALGRIRRDPLVGLPWTDRLERSELVVGLDEAAWMGLREEVAGAGIAGQLQQAVSKRRFGMYVRRLLGDRVGRVKFLPGKTTKEPAGARPTPDDLTRLGVEVDVYNSDLLGGRSAGAPGHPPSGLMATLRHLAAWRA